VAIWAEGFAVSEQAFLTSLFLLDADHNHWISELVHETMELQALDPGFREFIREKMMLGPMGAISGDDSWASHARTGGKSSLPRHCVRHVT
jgi:hypothetical protein